MTTMFVLAGGASHGAVQVGMLRALAHLGETPSRMIGTSIGALNAAVACQGDLSRSVDTLDDLWAQFARYSRNISFWRLTRSVLTRAESLCQPVGSDDELTGLLDTNRIEGTFTPLGIVATNLRTGREQLFLQGDITVAVRASSAVPGIFPPVRIGDDHFVDGLLFGAPIDHALRLGATRIFVLGAGHLSIQQKFASTWYGIARRAATLMTMRYFLRSVELAQRSAEVVVLPAPELVRSVSRRDFTSTRRLIDESESVTVAYLRETQALS